MFPFDDTGFSGSNFGGFSLDGFNSMNTEPTHPEFDNNFAGNWSGVNTHSSHPSVELDPFGRGLSTFQEAHPLHSQVDPSDSQPPIFEPSHWEAIDPYVGSTALDTVANTFPNPRMVSPVRLSRTMKIPLARSRVHDRFRPGKRIWLQLAYGVDDKLPRTGRRIGPRGEGHPAP